MNVLLRCALCLVVGNEPAAADAPISVRLESPKSEYVLGEVALFNVTVKNVTDSDVKVWTDLLRFQIQILIASEQAPFQEFIGEAILHSVVEAGPKQESLEPGHSKSYAFRVLYGPLSGQDTRKPWRLAFEQPGLYQVKARYVFPDRRKTVDSNTVQVDVKEPEWLDARLWEDLNSPELLYFLQAGRAQEKRAERVIVHRALGLFQRSTRNSYRPALEYALKNVYEDHRGEVLKELDDLRQWRRILRIEEPLPVVPDPSIWMKRAPPQDP